MIHELEHFGFTSGLDDAGYGIDAEVSSDDGVTDEPWRVGNSS